VLIGIDDSDPGIAANLTDRLFEPSSQQNQRHGTRPFLSRSFLRYQGATCGASQPPWRRTFRYPTCTRVTPQTTI